MPDFDLPSRWLRQNYEREDRLAVVLRYPATGSVSQKTATAEEIAAPKYQAHLRAANASGADVYVTMNVLAPEARSRTRADVNQIRHVYLDVDHGGREAIDRILREPGMPEPHHMFESSPGKYQLIWQVEGFEKEQAEELMRAYAAYFGADPAATDCSRVMRVPGFRNCKYEARHFVRDVQEKAVASVYTPGDYPRYATGQEHVIRAARRSAIVTGGSRSEADFAWAMRELARGKDESTIATELAARRPDKPNPTYYGRYTAHKAYERYVTQPVRGEAERQTDERER
jgi:hypothetical protein